MRLLLLSACAWLVSASPATAQECRERIAPISAVLQQWADTEPGDAGSGEGGENKSPVGVLAETGSAATIARQLTDLRDRALDLSEIGRERECLAVVREAEAMVSVLTGDAGQDYQGQAR